MRLLNFIDRGLARLEGFFLSFFLLVMILLAFAQVVARNFFSVGMIWADITVRTLLLWVGLLGASLATHLNQHLSIDVFAKFLGGRSRRVVGIFVKLFSVIVCLYLFMAASRFVQGERETGTRILETVPLWTTELIIPIAFALISFHFLVSILNDLTALFPGKKGAA